MSSGRQLDDGSHFLDGLEYLATKELATEPLSCAAGDHQSALPSVAEDLTRRLASPMDDDDGQQFANQ